MEWRNIDKSLDQCPLVDLSNTFQLPKKGSAISKMTVTCIKLSYYYLHPIVQKSQFLI